MHRHTVFEVRCAPVCFLLLSGISLRIAISLTLELYHSLFTLVVMYIFLPLLFPLSHSRLLIWNRKFSKVKKFSDFFLPSSSCSFSFLLFRSIICVYSLLNKSLSLTLSVSLFISFIIFHHSFDMHPSIQYSYILSLLACVYFCFVYFFFLIRLDTIHDVYYTWKGIE